MTPRRTTAYRRIVVKAGTALIGGDARGLDSSMMEALVEQIVGLHRDGVELLLVSSGAIAAGRYALGEERRASSVHMRQLFAAVGQGRLMSAYEQIFARHDVRVAQALLTGRDLGDRDGYLNVRNTLLGLIDRGVVPIINENDVVAVEEIEGEVFGDNDMLSAMVANIVDADLLIMLGEVDGLFTRDPKVYPDATMVPVVPEFTPEIEALAGPSSDKLGRGGMATKLDAAKLATASGVDAVVAAGADPDVITRLARGEAVGTYFPSHAARMESRKRYLLSQMRHSDAVVIDPGAVRALVQQNRSLLAAGVVDSVGDFDRGDVVMVVDSDQHQVACGIANYSSEDILTIRKLRSDRIESTLGHYYGDEVVHRDNIVILSG